VLRRRRRLALAALALSLAAACSTAARPPSATGPALPPATIDAALGTTLDAAGVKGTLLLYESGSGRVLVSDLARSETGFLPASTFKILNSLIGLETGAVRDADELFRWDGVDRGSAGWNADQTLRQAIARSTVWVYQEVARRVGPTRMQEWLSRVGYGNQAIGGGIDRFWLDGDLRVTPREQLAFLVRLERGDLPFSPRTQAAVREILERDRGEAPDGAWVLRAKSGWAFDVEPQIGWWVGWLDRAGRAPVFFVLNLDIARAEDAAKREQVVRAVLRERGYLPAG
jgi:beta-lactamase class D